MKGGKFEENEPSWWLRAAGVSLTLFSSSALLAIV
jgi:hypothetical protein